MTVDEMKKRKRELGLTNEELSNRSGVPVGTLNKIFSGQTRAPRKETILALESVLNKGSQVSYADHGILTDGTDPCAYFVCEPDNVYQVGTNPAKKRPGEYTLEDYLALPDDLRVELIDGYFYEMAAPHSVHQFIAIQIGYQLMSFVDKNHGPCKPVLSPIDVQLDRDDKTVVQPDVLVICDPKTLLRNGRVFGAPDLVIEILSPSTKKRDLTKKLAKYSGAGVRELWYVDPQKLQVLVYDLEESVFPVVYTFKDSIPVHIWEDKCSIDFTRVYEDIKDLLEE